MASHLRPPVNDKDHVAGSDLASIELVEYGDYQCPHCGAAYPVIKNIQSKMGNEIRFIFRNFPLSDAHPFAFAAAVATEAAAIQNKFWQMHDIIFENQHLLSEAGLLRMAANAGLDVEQFSNDIERQELLLKVEQDFESGIHSGVNGTPSFFINGIKFNGSTEELYSALR